VANSVIGAISFFFRLLSDTTGYTFAYLVDRIMAEKPEGLFWIFKKNSSAALH
jgi:hypothetical protein